MLLSLIMENCLPFTDDVMVVLVHKCVQQTHLLALYLETLVHILRLLNALNGQRAGFFIFAVVIICLSKKYTVSRDITLYLLLDSNKILMVGL